MSETATLACFSGTGNSLRVLDLCRIFLEGRGYDVDFILLPDSRPVDPDCRLFGFSFPVHALGVPRIAKTYLRGLPHREVPARAFVFVTGGDRDDVGWALRECEAILEPKNYSVVWADLIQMPNNWIPFSNVQPAEEQQFLFKRAGMKIESSLEGFLDGREYRKPTSLRRFGSIGSRLLHAAYFGRGVKELWKFFRTNGACTACGTCAKICPMGSIRMVDGRPVWSASCEQCMRCINFCPSRAVEQLDSIGRGHGRACYHEPHFNPLAGVRRRVEEEQV